MNKKDIINTLNYYYESPVCELHYKKDYELLLSVMLSAQTTDKRVNMVTENLYKEYNTLEKLNTLSVKEIEDKIKSIGLYKNKAKNFKQIVSSLIKIGGVVPNNRDILESMPGVGRKSTNVVLGLLYNEPCMAVDTHVTRLSKVFEIANDKDDVLKIEQKLMDYFPKKDWVKINHQMVLFGRYRCTAKKPQCSDCLLKDKCNKKSL